MSRNTLVLSLLIVIAVACSRSQDSRSNLTPSARFAHADLVPSVSPPPASTAATRVFSTVTPSAVDNKVSPTPSLHPFQPTIHTPTTSYQTGTPPLDPTLEAVLTSTPDFGLVVTRTPGLPRNCPMESTTLTPELPAELPVGNDWDPDAVLEYLNAGGSPSYLQIGLNLAERDFSYRDVTGDGVPEMLMRAGGFNFFICSDGHYESAIWLPPNNPGISPWIMAIEDMNLDGIPEVVVEDFIFSAESVQYYIYEWNGNEFELLTWPSKDLFAWYFTPKGQILNWYTRWDAYTLTIGLPEIEGIASSAEILDLDGDGIKEFVVHNLIPSSRHRAEEPWRETVDTYRWNGRIYIWDQLDIDPPVYRFQAVQDGDRMSLLGEYAKALDLYQLAIFNDQLIAWSYENYLAQLEAQWELTLTPTPIPLIQEEYDDLTAYALFRIMILHVLQDDLASARTVYESLREKFFDGQTGHAFVELADAFWRGYRSHANVGEGCLAVIEYAEANKSNLFAHLGGTPDNLYSHGTQSHIYTPWDTCPYTNR